MKRTKETIFSLFYSSAYNNFLSSMSTQCDSSYGGFLIIGSSKTF